MEIPAEALVETVISELRVETFQQDHDPKDCQICSFSDYLEKRNDGATTNDQLHVLDRMMKSFLESNCRTLPVLVYSGDLTTIVWLARACFIAGLKTGRMENSLKDLENLIR